MGSKKKAKKLSEAELEVIQSILENDNALATSLPTVRQMLKRGLLYRIRSSGEVRPSHRAMASFNRQRKFNARSTLSSFSVAPPKRKKRKFPKSLSLSEEKAFVVFCSLEDGECLLASWNSLIQE